MYDYMLENEDKELKKVGLKEAGLQNNLCLSLCGT